MRVVFTIAAENQTAYANMAVLWAWSIRNRGGSLATSELRVCFNDEAHPAAARILADDLGVNVEVRERVSRDYTFVNKYNVFYSEGIEDADWVVMLDCDTAICNPLNELETWMCNSQDDMGGVPVNTARVWGLGHVFKKYAQLTDEELEATRHPWFTDYPYFNGGVLALRGRHVPAFRELVVPWSCELFQSMRLRGSMPMHWLKLQWNRFWSKREGGEKRIMPPFFYKAYGDQVALAAAVLRLRLKYRVLPSIYNWIAEEKAHGDPDAPICILHYLKRQFPIDRDRLFDGEWIEESRRSPRRAHRELTKLIEEFTANMPDAPRAIAGSTG